MKIFKHLLIGSLTITIFYSEFTMYNAELINFEPTLCKDVVCALGISYLKGCRGAKQQ